VRLLILHVSGHDAKCKDRSKGAPDRSQWPRRSLAGTECSNPVGGIDVCCECCVFSGRGLCVGLITGPEEFYCACARVCARVCGVCVCARACVVCARAWCMCVRARVCGVCVRVCVCACARYLARSVEK